MAWRRPGDKPLSGPVMVRLLTHRCVTRPQWVNDTIITASWDLDLPLPCYAKNQIISVCLIYINFRSAARILEISSAIMNHIIMSTRGNEKSRWSWKFGGIHVYRCCQKWYCMHADTVMTKTAPGNNTWPAREGVMNTNAQMYLYTDANKQTLTW